MSRHAHDFGTTVLVHDHAEEPMTDPFESWQLGRPNPYRLRAEEFPMTDEKTTEVEVEVATQDPGMPEPTPPAPEPVPDPEPTDEDKGIDLGLEDKNA